MRGTARRPATATALALVALAALLALAAAAGGSSSPVAAADTSDCGARALRYDDADVPTCVRADDGGANGSVAAPLSAVGGGAAALPAGGTLPTEGALPPPRQWQGLWLFVALIIMRMLT